MAQGLDLKNWDDQKNPGTDAKMRLTAVLKRSRSSTGSRRIFPPQFKLQVLDSYRNDLDCRGNQRATARKYNIHRRQIQKWLQCEQNLRSSVEESSKRGDWSAAASGNEKAARKTADAFKTGLGGSGGKVDGATLNRSAMIYARLSDAERSKEESSPRRPTLNPDAAADVYDRRDSSSSSPSSSSSSSSSCSSSSSAAAALNLKRVAQKLYPSTSCVSRCWSPPRFVDASKLYETARLRLVDDNFNRVPPAPYPDDAKDADSVDGSLALGPSPVAYLPSLPVREPPRSPPCRVERTEPDAPSEHPPPAPSAPTSLRSEDEYEEEESAGEDAKKVADARLKILKDSDESKSFSPKRKWMQESMQESAVRATYTTLPIKQRVKMNLKSAGASSNASSEDAPTPAPKGVSPNFTIEKLCGSDIKTETVTPPSVHSPADAECYNKWGPSGSDPCTGYPGYPLPFPPPLLFSHRVIPDLVSLHFKPESLRDGTSHLLGSFPTDRRRRSSSSESLDGHLKEERLTDDEESADVDVLSTTPVEKKSFDFGGYNFGKRRSFSVQFKLTVLDAFYNDKDCNKNQRATARKFNINRRQVQKWLSQESDLRTEGSIKNGKYLQRQRLGSERDGSSAAAATTEETCKQCPQHCSGGSSSSSVRTKEEAADEDDGKGSESREDGSRSDGDTIEVNVKHCTDNECLTGERAASPGAGRTFADDGFHYYRKSFYPSDLKSAGVYEPQYLFPTDAPGMMMSGHGTLFGWPSFNASALQVPNLHFMASWYHHQHHHHHGQLGGQHHGFAEYCHEKSKIY